MNNYAAINPAGRIISWHETGNAAIDARDAYDAGHGLPRFSSLVLTAGQVQKAGIR
jgi:hypothetical protein